ncbi:MAG: DNA methyltransferase [Promethearchaeota archaeon]
MTQKTSVSRIEQLIEKHPEKTNRIIIFGFKINILENFRSFFKDLHPRLIFLDLSMHYCSVRREIREEFKDQLIEKHFNNSMNRENTQICEITEEFWRKIKKLVNCCKFILDGEGFFSVKTNGSIKSHLKTFLDGIFGGERFVNEIIINSPYKHWYTPCSTVFERTDYILLYSQSPDPRINPVLNEKESGGYWHSFVSKGQGTPKKFIFRDIGEVILAPPPGTHWKLKQETILDLCAKGQIRLNKKGNPEYWVPPKRGQIIDSNWLDIQSFELGLNHKFLISSSIYSRLMSMCLKEKDLFLDLSVDFGESLVVADRLKLKWIGLGKNEHILEGISKKLTKNGIFFTAYVYNSFTDSLDNFRDFYNQNKVVNIVSHAKNEKFLQLTEKFRTQQQIPNMERSVEWANMLILGDSFDVIPLLEPKLREKLKVIYIDPPFFTGTNENIVIPICLSTERDSDSTEDINYPIEDLAYKNVLDESDPIDFFKKWFKKRILLMKPLLREDGFIFVRFDYHFGHYAKIVLDEVFGRQNFVNEFLVRRMKKNLSLKQAYSQTHLIVHSDSVLTYQKSEKAKLKTSHIKKRKRRSQDFVERQYSNDNIWLDIAGYEKLKKTLYPTENSESLLSRIIQVSSEKGDIIADFFCGSGTTVAVAEKLERKWLGVDIGQYSIHEIKKRILKIPYYKPFNVLKISSFNALKTSNRNYNVPIVKLRSKVRDKTLVITITEFIPSKCIDISKKHDFIDFIDYWVIDWNYRGNVFEARWCSYRELKGKKVLKHILVSATHKYSKAGSYIVAVAVIDVFGNDTKQFIVIETC